MTQPLLVGLDVGTTASKAVVFTLAGQPLAEGRAVTPWQPAAAGAGLDPRGVLPPRRAAPGRGAAPHAVAAGGVGSRAGPAGAARRGAARRRRRARRGAARAGGR